MKTLQWALALGLLAAVGPNPTPAGAAESNGVALAIVYDTSGSMRERVRDRNGGLTPKYLIANRALENIATRIEAFAGHPAGGASHDIQAALFVFERDSARQVVKFGPFEAGAFKDWAREFSSPKGATPLGNALAEASRTVLNCGLPRKHVLVITDGKNNQGPTPAAVMEQIKGQTETPATNVSIHFVAFDVDARVFSDVKKLGATVVGAADEIQLNKQLAFILEKKILLEDEEPPKKQ